MNDLGAKYRAKKKKPNEKKTIKVKTEKKFKIPKNDEENTDFEEFKDIQSENATESEDYETDSNKSEDNFKTDLVKSEKILPLETDSSDKDQNKKIKSIIPKKAIKVDELKKSSSKFDTSAESLQEETNDSETEIPLLVSAQLSETNQNSSTKKSVDKIEVELNKKPVKRKSELNSSNRVDYKKKKNIIDEVKPICETVDSFFMTADDKDYMSVYKPPPSVQKNYEDHPKLEYSKPVKKEIFIKGKKVVVGKNHMGNRRERRQQQIEEPIDTVLHPSWEAKRKQKSLAKFEGKKITFDDQD